MRCRAPTPTISDRIARSRPRRPMGRTRPGSYGSKRTTTRTAYSPRRPCRCWPRRGRRWAAADRGGAADHRAAPARPGTAGVSRRGGSHEAGTFASLYPNGPHRRRGNPMSKKLEGKVAVITGGNSGIGLATARRFVAEGAHVFITGRRPAELDEAVRQIGRNVTAVQGDVSHLTDLDRLFATVKKQQG